MSKIMDWVKAHPKSTAALVIGGGLVFILLSGVLSGGGGGTTVTSSGPSDAQLAASTQVQLAGIAAGANNAQAAAELKASELAAAVAMAQIGANKDVSLADITAQYNIQNSSIASQTALQQQNLSVQSQMFTIQNQTAKDIAALDSATQISTANIAKDVAVTQNTNATNVQLSQINTSAEVTKAVIEALKPQAPVVQTPVVQPGIKANNVWDAILIDRPDVEATWTSTAQYNTKYGGNEEAWVQDWYSQWGAASGYALPTYHV